MKINFLNRGSVRQKRILNYMHSVLSITNCCLFCRTQWRVYAHIHKITIAMVSNKQQQKRKNSFQCGYRLSLYRWSFRCVFSVYVWTSCHWVELKGRGSAKKKKKEVRKAPKSAVIGSESTDLLISDDNVLSINISFSTAHHIIDSSRLQRRNI